MAKLILLFVVLTGFGCAKGHCRKVHGPEVASNAVVETSEKAANETVQVYKYDGSKQCSKTPGISLEKMKLQLDGIAIHSQVKKSDGLMHIQVCGSNAGVVNIFEIDASELKRAQERGFKEWRNN